MEALLRAGCSLTDTDCEGVSALVAATSSKAAAVLEAMVHHASEEDVAALLVTAASFVSTSLLQSLLDRIGVAALTAEVCTSGCV